jgi:hypothetical protein
VSRTRDVNPSEPHARERRELVRLVQQIQDLFLELELLRSREDAGEELRAKERELEELRWRLAVVARRSAPDDVDVAA